MRSLASLRVTRVLMLKGILAGALAAGGAVWRGQTSGVATAIANAMIAAGIAYLGYVLMFWPAVAWLRWLEPRRRTFALSVLAYGAGAALLVGAFGVRLVLADPKAGWWVVPMFAGVSFFGGCVIGAMMWVARSWLRQRRTRVAA